MVKGNDMKGITGIIIAVILSSAYCYSQDTIAKPKIEVSGRAAFESGQIYNGKLTGRLLNSKREWIHRDLLNFSISAKPSDRLTVLFAPEIKLWFNSIPISNSKSLSPFRQYFTVTVLEGQGIYNFFGADNPALTLAAGFFTYKYNPDAQNLGEYLFRTGAYPPYILTSFDYPFAQLAGFKLSSTLFNFLQQDLILNPELLVQPLHDWSLAYLVNTHFKLLDVGAAVNFHHWFSINDVMTTPKKDIQNTFYTEDGTKSYFSFKGIKLMGRIAFDPKGLLPSDIAEKLGPHEMRLYMEGSVLGLNNYIAYKKTFNGTDSVLLRDTTKNYYADRNYRMPVMVGFSFPTAKLFNNLSVEIESFQWPYPNVYYNASFHEVTPIPIGLPADFSKEDYKYDNWKWSLNLKKTIVNGFSVVGQISQDHMRHDLFFESDRDEEEVLTRSNAWNWMARVEYAF
jgi:hypothetical protein